ncbi:MAG: DNA translocase FtsK, partial [Planctomycetaceae bacterium]|nr:DNA translocase FtsK [Planctomycetaceae bacterium]
MFGAWTGIVLTEKFSQVGVIILSISLLIAGWLMCPLSDLSRPLLRFASAPMSVASAGVGLLRRRAAWKPQRTTVSVGPEPDRDDDHDADTVPFRVNPPAAMEPVEADPVEEDEEDDRSIRINPPATLSLHTADAEPEDQPRSYSLPPLDLLEHAEDFPYELLAKKARIAAATLEKTFEEFGLNIKVSEIDTGPVVTQFELELEPGLRVNKVTALEDDLAIALRVPSVRVVAPIPGKNTVGVEVPNEKQVMVRLKELLVASRVQSDEMRLPLFLGKDVSGHSLAVDMCKMPHLLIA